MYSKPFTSRLSGTSSPNHRLKTETAFCFFLPEQSLCSAVITASSSGQDNYGYDDIQSIDDKRSVSL